METWQITQDRRYVNRALRRAARRIASAVGSATGERPEWHDPTDASLTFDENLEMLALETAWHLEDTGTDARTANRVLREIAAFGTGMACGLDANAVRRDSLRRLSARISEYSAQGRGFRDTVKRLRRQRELVAEIVTADEWADYIGDNLTAGLVSRRKGAYRVPDEWR